MSGRAPPRWALALASLLITSWPVWAGRHEPFSATDTLWFFGSWSGVVLALALWRPKAHGPGGPPR